MGFHEHSVKIIVGFKPVNKDSIKQKSDLEGRLTSFSCQSMQLLTRQCWFC